MPALDTGMVAFDASTYPDTVEHLARVTTGGEYGEDEETWPGPGTLLPAHAAQGIPQDRQGQQVEETVTGWIVWFPYQALVEAGIVIRRGDNLVLADPHAGPITLRVDSKMTDYGGQGVTWFVQCKQID